VNSGIMKLYTIPREVLRVKYWSKMPMLTPRHKQGQIQQQSNFAGLRGQKGSMRPMMCEWMSWTWYSTSVEGYLFGFRPGQEGKDASPLRETSYRDINLVNDASTLLVSLEVLNVHIAIFETIRHSLSKTTVQSLKTRSLATMYHSTVHG